MKEEIEILQEKKELLESLLSTIKQATRLLAEDDIEGFDSELKSCEQIMRQVDALGGTPKTSNREAAVLETENDIERILKQIFEANKECKSASEEKLKGLGRQIKNLRNTKQGMNSYNKTTRGAVFIDEKK